MKRLVTLLRRKGDLEEALELNNHLIARVAFAENSTRDIAEGNKDLLNPWALEHIQSELRGMNQEIFEIERLLKKTLGIGGRG